MEIEKDTRSGWEKVFKYFLDRPALLAAVALFVLSWGSLLLHLVAMPLLLFAMYFYLSSVRFNEGRYYERALQESKPKHEAIGEAKSLAHADALTSLKQSIGFGKK
jgi:hypothetical protein